MGWKKGTGWREVASYLDGRMANNCCFEDGRVRVGI